MKSKLSIFLFPAFLIISLNTIAMDQEEKSIVTYKPTSNTVSLPVSVVQGKNQINVQFSTTNYEEESLIPIVKIPYLPHGYRIIYQIDSEDLAAINQNTSSSSIDHKNEILKEIKKLSIVRQDSYESSQGKQSASSSRILDIKELAKVIINANYSTLCKKIANDIQNNNIDLKTKNTLKSILKDDVFSEYKPEFKLNLKDEILAANKENSLESSKDDSWEKNKEYFKTTKLNWYQRHPFKFASFIGFGLFIAGPFIQNAAKTWFNQFDISTIFKAAIAKKSS